jgi:type IV pilus assembly protein PilF
MKAIAMMLSLALAAGCTSTGPRNDDARVESQNRARAHTDLGVAYYEVGQMKVALEELKVALSADPAYVPALNQIGLVYVALKEDDKAQQAFEKALGIEPDDSATNNNYGLFLCQRKREKESLRYFMAALKNPLYQTPENAYTNAGICARMMGDQVKAEEWLRKAIAIQPNQPQALYQLADISFRRGDLPSARTLLTRHLQVAAPSAEALWLGARVANLTGDRNALASYGTQLNNRFPGTVQAKAFNEGRFQ